MDDGISYWNLSSKYCGYSLILPISQSFYDGEGKYLVKRGFFLIIALLFPFITTISLSPSPSSNPGVSSPPILDPGARLLRLASRALAAISNGILALRLGPAWGEDVA